MDIEAQFQQAKATPDSNLGGYAVLPLLDAPPPHRIWLGWTAFATRCAIFEDPTEEFQEYTLSQAVNVNHKRLALQTARTEINAVILECLDSRVGSVFALFVGDVIRNLASEPPHRTIATTANRWRSLFAKAQQEISDSTVFGLFGELCFLEKISATLGPRALDYWRGPLGDRHDFAGSDRSVEVKTSALQSRAELPIHGLRQLQPVEGSGLTLALAEAERDPGGRTLTEIIESLHAKGVDAESLELLLLQLGIAVSVPELNANRFTLRRWHFWNIDDSFPRITPDMLPGATVNAVAEVTYRLSLSSLPEADRDFDVAELGTLGETE